MRSRFALSFAWLLVAGCYQAHSFGVDGGPLPDTGPRPDGAASDAAVLCSEETLTPYTGPPCSDAVNACRSRCAPMDEMCRDACLDAQCHTCVYATIFHCANALGCAQRWHDFACCVEGVPGCTALRGFDRVMCAPRCPMLFQPYADCIPTTGETCFLEAARTCGLR